MQPALLSYEQHAHRPGQKNHKIYGQEKWEISVTMVRPQSHGVHEERARQEQHSNDAQDSWTIHPMHCTDTHVLWQWGMLLRRLKLHYELLMSVAE